MTAAETRYQRELREQIERDQAHRDLHDLLPPEAAIPGLHYNDDLSKAWDGWYACPIEFPEGEVRTAHAERMIRCASIEWLVDHGWLLMKTETGRGFRLRKAVPPPKGGWLWCKSEQLVDALLQAVRKQVAA